MTFEEAADDIQEMFQAAWNAQSAPVPKIYYEGVGADTHKGLEPYARVYCMFLSGRNAALGGKLFERSGVLKVQIMTPVAKDLHRKYRLAKIVTDAFEGKSSPLGVWFRNVRVVDIGKDGQFLGTEVNVEFEYTESK